MSCIAASLSTRFVLAAALLFAGSAPTVPAAAAAAFRLAVGLAGAALSAARNRHALAAADSAAVEREGSADSEPGRTRPDPPHQC